MDTGPGSLPEWRITCFFVVKDAGQQGVASVALAGARSQIARLRADSTGRRGAELFAAGQEVAEEDDAFAVSPFFNELERCDLPPFRKKAPAFSQYERTNEEPNLIDEIRAKKIVAELDATREHNVQAFLRCNLYNFLGEAVASTKNSRACPTRIPECARHHLLRNTVEVVSNPCLVINALRPEATHLLLSYNDASHESSRWVSCEPVRPTPAPVHHATGNIRRQAQTRLFRFSGRRRHSPTEPSIDSRIRSA